MSRAKRPVLWLTLLLVWLDQNTCPATGILGFNAYMYIDARRWDLLEQRSEERDANKDDNTEMIRTTNKQEHTKETKMKEVSYTIHIYIYIYIHIYIYMYTKNNDKQQTKTIKIFKKIIKKYINDIN